MLLDIRTAFDEMVTELDWMDVDTKARAHRKLSAMRPFVGFPDWITDTEEMDKYYKGVSTLNTSYACVQSYSQITVSLFV